MTELAIRSGAAEFADIGGDRDLWLYEGRGERRMWLCLSRDGDPLRVDPRADFAEQLASEGGRFPAGLMWSIRLGGSGLHRVLAVGGLEPLGARRWGAWAFASDLSRRQWAFAAWAARRVLRWAWRRGLTIQAVPAATPQAVRLLKRIGFVDVGEAYMVWEG